MVVSENHIMASTLTCSQVSKKSVAIPLWLNIGEYDGGKIGKEGSTGLIWLKLKDITSENFSKTWLHELILELFLGPKKEPVVLWNPEVKLH